MNRSQYRRPAIWATVSLVVILIALEVWKRGCLLYFASPLALLVQVVFIWAIAFAVASLRRWRWIAMSIVSLVVVSIAIRLGGEFIAPAPRIETNVIKVLAEMQSSVEQYAKAHPEDGYPRTFSSLSSQSEKYYTFYYVPGNVVGGRIVGYQLDARPKCPKCGLSRSFLTTEDGRIFVTDEDRPATTQDKLLRGAQR